MSANLGVFVFKFFQNKDAKFNSIVDKSSFNERTRPSPTCTQFNGAYEALQIFHAVWFSSDLDERRCVS